MPDIDHRFRQIFLLLDSDHRGEREAALERIYTLRRLNEWPMFKDMVDGSPAVQTTAPPTAATEAEIARLRQEIARLAGEMETLRNERLSWETAYRFDHNDLSHAKSNLEKYESLGVWGLIKLIDKKPGGDTLLGIVICAFMLAALAIFWAFRFY